MKPWHVVMLGCMLLLCSWPHAVSADKQQPAARSTAWHELPLPDGRYGGSDLAKAKCGTVWSLMRDGLYYWDGFGFSPPRNGGEYRSGAYLTRLIGGTDRPLYASQTDDRENQGKLFLLTDGLAEYETDFYFEEGTYPPGVHVTRSGLIINWGEHFLAVYSDGTWTRHQLDVGIAKVQVIEVADRVCILGNHPATLYVIDASGQVTERAMTFGETVALEKPPHILPWGTRRLMALSDEVQSVLAFDILSGEPVDTRALNRQLKERKRFAYFGQHVGLARRDGSIWLRIRVDDMYAFDRISPEGEVTFVEGSASRAWSRGSIVTFPNVFQETSDGALWFALDDTTIARFKEGRLQSYDWRDGLAFGKFNHLLEGSRGEVYAASSSAIVVWQPTELRPVARWTQDWDQFETASYAPIRDYHGNIWMLQRGKPGEISRWDGAAWHHQPVPFDTTKIYR
ncbi:MAG: hypothetical protein ABI619_01880, partial [Betaproteobacteria bacterium]